MSLRAAAQREHPDFPWLAAGDTAGVEAFCRARGWLAADEALRSCERAGEGNMNLTLRLRTDTRSLILKQARPWVEKYDAIPAPWERSVVERRFYQCVATIPAVAAGMPRLLASDDEARALLLEDLADAADLTDLYAGGSLGDDELAALAAWAAALHASTRGREAEGLANPAMRALNHEHLFALPLSADNGLPLDDHEPGLVAAAAGLRADARYGERVAALGARYRDAERPGTCLVHGDYFPGSWLRTRDGLRVIDPEFGFVGDPELDVGFALAHLALASQPVAAAERFVRAYEKEGGLALEAGRLAGYAGVEVMRRLIGVAQLPLPAAAPGETPRAALLARSRAAVVEGTWRALWPGP